MTQSASKELSNPFLTDNFAPVKEEIILENLPVIGKIPDNLNGSFVRNGPNPQYDPIGQYHWFDGDGMLHQVEIKQGKATYRNRYVKTPGFLAEQEANKAIYTGLLEPARDGYKSGKNVSNTALVWHSNKLLSLWEGGEPYHIELPTLETIGKETFNQKLNTSFTAHPKVDPITGEMMFISYNMIQPPFLRYGIVDSEGEIKHFIPIDLPVGVMMHDFAVTENYTIFLNLPYTFRPERMARGESPLAFEANTPSSFGILPRHGKPEDILWFTADSCYMFHTLNAYESGDEIVLLGCRMAKTEVLSSTDDSESSFGDSLPFLTKWQFNLKTKQIQEERVDQRPSEFPRVNEQYLGRKTRYGYVGAMAPQPLPLFDGVIKYDFQSGESWEYKYGEGRYGGEVVFAPNPEGNTEDDGWLMTYVYDQSTQKSELIIINAQDFTAESIVRVELPCRVPYGFHGTWIEAK